MKVINLGNTLYTNYLVTLDDGTSVLIDFGNNTSYKKYLQKLSAAGVAPESVKYGVLTHVHADHISYLAGAAEKGVTVILHDRARANLLVGHDNLKTYSSKLNKKVSELSAKFRGGPACWKPFDVEEYGHINVDGDVRFDDIGATVFTLSGHTVDSIGILFDDGKCFIGDAVMNSVPAKHLMPLLIEDEEGFKKSYKKLIALNAKEYYVGHGAPITRADLEKNLKFAEALEIF